MSKWLETKSPLYYENGFSSSVVINGSDIGNLVEASVKPSLSESFIGTFDSWCSSFIWFPFEIKHMGNDWNSYLSIGPKSFPPQISINPIEIIDGTGVKASYMVYEYFGYTLGEYHHTRKYNDYRDYEPYTTVSIYLPYYGYIDLPTKEIIDKFVQFRLYVDFKSGASMYIVGVNDNSVANPNPPFAVYVDDTDTRIIGTYNFKIGTDLALGKSNLADVQRNVFLGALRGAVSVGSAMTPLVHRSVTTQQPTVTKSSKTYMARNKKGQFAGRRQVVGEKTETKGDKVTESKSYGKPLSSTASMLVDIASGMTSTPQVEKTDNAIFGVHTTQNIKIVIREAKILPVDSNYAHIYGLPLGEVKQLSQIYGYAEVSETHIEGSFGAITEDERSQIDGLLSSGVIFPNPPTT